MSSVLLILGGGIFFVSIVVIMPFVLGMTVLTPVQVTYAILGAFFGLGLIIAGFWSKDN